MPHGCVQLGGGAECHVNAWRWEAARFMSLRPLAAMPAARAERGMLFAEQLLHGPGLTSKTSSPPIAVRVVNNVVKRNDVRSRLYAAVQGENYPEAFMYKQKVRLAVVCSCAAPSLLVC